MQVVQAILKPPEKPKKKIVVQAKLIGEPDPPIPRVPRTPRTDIKPGMKRVWDNYEEIGEVQKSERIKFIIGVGTRKGFKYINIREFYKKKSDEIWRPGSDGITIPLVVPFNQNTTPIYPYKGFVDLLTKAAERLDVMELYDEEHAVWLPRKYGRYLNGKDKNSRNKPE